jgi:hypothetical protein
MNTEVLKELDKDFWHDLSVFMEQLERHGFIRSSMTNEEEGKLHDLMDETVKLLIESVKAYD